MYSQQQHRFVRFSVLIVSITTHVVANVVYKLDVYVLVIKEWKMPVGSTYIQDNQDQETMVKTKAGTGELCKQTNQKAGNCCHKLLPQIIFGWFISIFWRY